MLWNTQLPLLSRQPNVRGASWLECQDQPSINPWHGDAHAWCITKPVICCEGWEWSRHSTEMIIKLLRSVYCCSFSHFSTLCGRNLKSRLFQLPGQPSTLSWDSCGVLRNSACVSSTWCSTIRLVLIVMKTPWQFKNGKCVMMFCALEEGIRNVTYEAGCWQWLDCVALHR